MQQKNKIIKMKLSIFITIFIFFASCLFSGSDIYETAIVGDYYIIYAGEEHQLIKKDDEAVTSAVIISSNIDSIGYNSKYILAVSGNKYFVVDYKGEDAVDSLKIYTNRIELLSAVEVKGIIVKKVN